mmetsp:Transcript_21225/g.43801  ORF Transcript_21225/g.43801 Transcript_21225/m.43801 type:complete len:288 (+) Transcript_21225:186-1049(+)
MKFTLSALSIISAVANTANAQSIYEIASGNDSFTTLTAAVDAAGLDATLTGDGTFTIFAPTNDAFDALPAGTVDKLLQPEWIHHLTDVLLYHGLGSVVMSTDLTDGLSAETLNGESITINLDPAVITTVSNTTSNILVDAGLVDIAADNGVIHAVDAVLLPTSATSSIVDLAVADPVFSTLVAAVTAADLVGALSGDGPFTLFGERLSCISRVECTMSTCLFSLTLFSLSLSYRFAPSLSSPHERCLRRPPGRNPRFPPPPRKQKRSRRHPHLPRRGGHRPQLGHHQ